MAQAPSSVSFHTKGDESGERRVVGLTTQESNTVAGQRRTRTGLPPVRLLRRRPLPEQIQFVRSVMRIRCAPGRIRRQDSIPAGDDYTGMHCSVMASGEPAITLYPVAMSVH